jgi:excisionase family DNA binding protein
MTAVLTVEQVAEMLHMSKTKLYSLVKAGKIPARRIGGRRAPLLFKPEEIEAVFESAKVITDKVNISEPVGPAPEDTGTP